MNLTESLMGLLHPKPPPQTPSPPPTSTSTSTSTLLDTLKHFIKHLALIYKYLTFLQHYLNLKDSSLPIKPCITTCLQSSQPPLNLVLHIRFLNLQTSFFGSQEIVMEDLNPGFLLELVVGNNGDRINVVSYVGAEDGLLSVEKCKFDDRERTFRPISFGDPGYARRLLQGLKRRALRPSPPSELTHPVQILPGQLIEARRPFGYSVCLVHKVLGDGNVQVRHRNERIQTIHRRNLRNHLKYRRHKKDWVVRTLVSSGLVEEESKRQKACS